MDDPLREAQSRLQRYTVVDGLHEIGAALIFALTAVWVWTSDLSSLPRFWKQAFSVTFPVMIWAGMWAERRIVKAIRRRLTYPRAGFAEERRPPRRRTLVIGLLSALSAA